jgi:hypothetical protein
MNMNQMHKRSFRSHSYTVHVQPSDQKRLQQFALHELAYYNTVIEALESRTRAFPKQVAELTPTQIEAVCESVKLNTITEAVHKPDWLSFVVGQILKPKVVMIPETRVIMTRTLFEFFRDQAQILKEPINNDKLEISYRVSPQNLSKLDAQQKRHVQIPRSQVKIRWDTEQDCSLISTPLNAEPIQIPGINLNEREGWHMMVIRQEPGRWVSPDTPWMVEFRHTHNQYLIRLTDAGSNKGIPR